MTAMISASGSVCSRAMFSAPALKPVQTMSRYLNRAPSSAQRAATGALYSASGVLLTMISASKLG